MLYYTILAIVIVLIPVGIGGLLYDMIRKENEKFKKMSPEERRKYQEEMRKHQM